MPSIPHEAMQGGEVEERKGDRGLGEEEEEGEGREQGGGVGVMK